MLRPAPLLVTLFVCLPAAAQNLQVIPVPWIPTDPAVPHAAYNGHATTFKAIARGGNGSYQYEWDFQGDGTFDFSATTSNRYTLSTRFTYPNQAGDVMFLARVRVTSGGQSVTATYPVHVFADVPTNPANANERQLQIMRNVAIDDGLWYLHNQMSRSGNDADPITGAQITGNPGAASTYGASAVLEALGRNQHYVAFPAAYIGTMPNPGENAQRWATDPYAEDAARLTNYLLTQGCPVSVAAADESNLTGFYPEVSATPIPGTDDGFGFYIGSSPCDQTTGYTAAAIRGLSWARLTGFVAQVGDQNRILGRPFEFVIQQLVDGLVWAQNDGGGYPGSWYYGPNQNSDWMVEFYVGSLEAAQGLWAAETLMGSSGVIVPNLAKARLVSYLFQNYNSCPGGGTGAANAASYSACDLAITAVIPHALGWLGANRYSTNDNRLAFPGYSNPTFGQLRQLWDSTLTFISSSFAGSQSSSIGWDTGFVTGGDFGRIDGQGNHFAMSRWARAARAAQPETVTYGTNDWWRLFSRYFINNQATDGNWNWQYGSTSPNNDNMAGAPVRAAWAISVLSADEMPPVVAANVSATTISEGTSITVSAFATAPGTVTWTFGNGQTATGPNVDYTYPDNGSFNVVATVTTAGGATGEQTIPITVSNVAPVADAGADLFVNEGTPVTLSGSFADRGAADTHTVAWDLGDGTQGNARDVVHTYADQGTFTATFTVTDDDLGSHQDSVTITVGNVAPTITSAPGGSATTGNPYGYTLTFTDPGPNDTHTCSIMTAPQGATLTGCALSWTPTAAQGGAPQAFTLCVTDDDNGRTCESFTVTVPVTDTDGDGLPDPWEVTFFGGLAQVGTADPDRDGVTNSAELAANTDPTMFDGPSAPTLPMPACATRVANNRPTLSVTNATDPQGTALTYAFEVYEDSALTTLIASASWVTSGAATTQWQVTATLQEDATYYWRARAADAFASGPWTTPACSFTVDMTNGPPSAPRVDMPADGAVVTTTAPTLTVSNAVDPEGDTLTYEFELFRNGARIAGMANVPQGTGSTTSWVVTNMLMEDALYTWHARAVSAGGPGPFSATSTFRVNLANAAPPAPGIVSPQNGAALETLSPRLVFLPVEDPDGDALVYDWELVAGDDFTTPLASGSDVTDNQIVLASPLTEDTRYCWRVRGDDGQAQGAWTRACFTASASDAAPAVPTPVSPTGGRTVADLHPVFSWAGSSDPERDPVTYDLELSSGGNLVTTISGIAGKTALIPEPLTDGASYTWRVRAHAGAGPSSAWSETAAFQVQLPEQPEPTTPITSGCGCGASSGSAFFPLALALLLRRRRPGQRESSRRCAAMLRRAPLLVTLLFGLPAAAQDLQVIPVPWSALDPTVPHAAYNGRATTFKAIARGGDGSYDYEWDFEGDGVFDFSATTTNRYNLSTRFTYPNQTNSVTFNARVRVTSAGQTVTATYPVRVLHDVPADPASANERQLQIMRNAAIDDALWYLHNQMTRTGDENHPVTGAQIMGNIGGPVTYAAGTYLELLGRNQHYAAFPAAYVGAMPDPQQNAQRWANDPYAEDAARLVNHLLSQACAVSVGTNPGNTQSSPNDESNATGFYPEVLAAPIPGTDDGIGLFIGTTPCDQSVGVAGAALRGLATSRLAGFVAQVGDQTRVLGRKLEFVIQQLVDGLVWAQNDGGSYPGSWYYTPNANVDLLGEQISGTNEVITGLWAADVFMRAHGVIVPNIVKVRLVSYVFQGSRSCNGGTGGSMQVGTCDFTNSSVHTFALGWVGATLYAANDPRLAFPGYSLNVTPTRGQLRSQLNSSLAFITNTFNQVWPGQVSWDMGFVHQADYTRTDGLGDLYAMMHWARASRVHEPEIVNYGSNDWARLFSRFLIRNQLPDGEVNWVFSSSLGAHNDNAVGAAVRTAFMGIILSPDERPPLVTATASLTTAPEGTRITFTAQSTAPGTVTWTFGNGQTATGASVDYSYPDDGAFNVVATVTTSGGATGQDVIPVTMTNVAPVADAGADVIVDEGTPVSFAGAFTDPGTADTQTFAWDFGDGTLGNARLATHPYAEQGTFTARFTVTDDDTGTSSDTSTITVRNAAPTITSTPGTTAAVGTPYSYTLTFTDPGTTDTHTCSVMTAPQGATLTGCAVSWTPSANQVGTPQAFILCVTDDDNGRTCQSFAVSVPIVDTDSDGLSDPWETGFFGNLNQTAGTDPDLDGVPNGTEFTAGTNPTVFDGPTAPTLPMPACGGGRVASTRPTLSVTNATDPQGTPLTYEFEVYEDAALTALIAMVSGVPAGTGTTQWRVTVTLQEDATYYWRARAADASAFGPWSTPLCSFTVNITDSLPTAPQPDMPSNGATLTTTTPTLTILNAVDPEGDALTYEFEVFRGAARVASMTNVAQGSSSTTSWTVTNMLLEDLVYTWHARAVSAGGPGPYSAMATFRINTGNAAPSAPGIVSPQNGIALDTLSPRLVFLPVVDPDGDAIVYDWQLVAGDDFTTPLASGTGVTEHQVSLPTSLTEDARYCWRVRADDGQSQSAWTRACFTASASDAAPGVPTLISPTSGRVVTTVSPVFAWTSSGDPEREAVTYDLELSTGGSVVTTVTGLAGKTALLPDPLTDATTYSWRVRAHAGSGPSSDWSELGTFSVNLPDAPEPTPPTAAGCGCGATSGGALFPLVLALLLRRRRRN